MTVGGKTIAVFIGECINIAIKYLSTIRQTPIGPYDRRDNDKLGLLHA